MNPVLIVLVLLGMILLWTLCSFLFRPIGNVAEKLIHDVQEAISEEDENENKK